MTTSGGGGGDKPWEEMTWGEVIAATKTDKYKEFEIGAMKELDLGTEGIVHMQIVGIDVDDLADGSGKAPLTFISHELLKTSHKMNSSNTNVGGWMQSSMRSWLRNTVMSLIPVDVASEIKEVSKYTYQYDTSQNNRKITETVWIPSKREVNFSGAYESLGPVYSEVFSDAEHRIKMKTEGTIAMAWWLRSTHTTTDKKSFAEVSASGSASTLTASNSQGVALGFCL